MNLLSQIKNLLEDIENCDVKNDNYLKHVELVKLILLNLPNLDRETINTMAEDNMLSDVFYEYNESTKIISDFFSKNLSFIEDDIKGSSFEKEIIKNKNFIELLRLELIKQQDKYEELKKLENDEKYLKNQVLEFESYIKEFEEINLEQIESQKEKLENELNHLKETEGEKLIEYKKHLAINDFINIKTKELYFLSSEISEKLSNMDNLYKDILNKRS